MDSRASRKTEGSGSDPKDKGSLDKHSKETQRSPGVLTAESPDDSVDKGSLIDHSKEKQRSPGALTAGSHDTSEDKGSLIKHSKTKEGSPGNLTEGSPDTSEGKSDAKISDSGDSSLSLPGNPGMSALGSLLQVKIDPSGNRRYGSIPGLIHPGIASIVRYQV
jgi:hypothetical protein